MTLTFDDVTYTRDSGGTRVNAAGLIVGVDFSVTSVTFGTGPQTFTLAADANVNRDWPIGSRVRATSQAAPLGLMNGTVTSYDPSTQELVIEVTESTGTGTSTDWRIGSLEFRRDFDPVTLAPRGGLVEGGGTNRVTNSESLSSLNLTGVTIGSDPIASPSGNINFQRLVESADNTAHVVQIVFAPLLGANTQSFFIKAGANLAVGKSIKFRPNNQSGNGENQYSAIDPSTGAILVNAVGHKINVEPYPNGVYKVSCTFYSSGTANASYSIGFWDGVSGLAANYLGDGVSDIYLWGVSYTGSESGSYIPTTTVSVSRAADLLAVDGANFTQAYNQSQGTLLVECIPTESVNSSAIASINDGTLDNEIRVGQKQTGTRSSIRAIASDASTDVLGLNATGNNLIRSNGVDYDELNTGIAATMLGVANNGSQFLAAGSLGAFASGDGTTFVQRSIERDTLNGAHFGIGRFVIGAAATDGVGSVRVSTDGLAFRRINIAGLTQNLNEVTSNGTNQYVAVGAGGVIYTSSDAEVWTAQVSGVGTAAFGGVHYFGGRYVAVTSNAQTTRYSDDGVTWLSTSGLNATMFDVYHNGTNLWIAVGTGGAIYSSPDGITWTAQTSGVTAQLNGIHFADGLWVAVGNAGTVVTSPDGITWTDRTATSNTTVTINEVNFFNGSFYYVGSAAVVGQNTAAGIVAGTTWTLRTSNVTSALNGIATNGSRLLVCGVVGGIATSDEGTTFTSRTGNNATLNGAAFGNSTYVVVGNAVNGSGLIATVDPVTFAYQRRVSNTTQSLNKVKQHRGNFYAAGNSSRIIRSIDALSWNELIIGGTAFNVFGTSDSGSLILAIGSGGRFSTSADGLTWAASALNGLTTQQLNATDFANDKFVVVGNAGTILTYNGTEWTQRTSNTTANLYAVHYSTRDQQWYAAGDNGTILRSADAITWESIANDAVGAVVTNGEVSVNPIAAKIIPKKRNRIALSWSSEGASLSVNGSVAALDPSLVMPIVDRITIGRRGDSSNFLNAPFKVLKTYKAKVSDTELQAITRI